MEMQNSKDEKTSLDSKAEFLEFLDRRLSKINEACGYAKGDERLEYLGRMREIIEMKERMSRGSDKLESEERFEETLSGLLRENK